MASATLVIPNKDGRILVAAFLFPAVLLLVVAVAITSVSTGQRHDEIQRRQMEIEGRDPSEYEATAGRPWGIGLFLVGCAVPLYLLAARMVTTLRLDDRVHVLRGCGLSKHFAPEDVQIGNVRIKRKKRGLKSLKLGFARAGINLCIMPREGSAEYRLVVDQATLDRVRDFCAERYEPSPFVLDESAG